MYILLTLTVDITHLGTGHLIFRGGGGWDFFEKNSLFPYMSKKNKMSSTKLKINSLFFIQQIFLKPFFPQSYRGLQITQNLTCKKHVVLLLASSVLNVNYQMRKSIGIFVRTNCCITCSFGS